MEGRCFTAPELSAPLSDVSAFAGPGVEAGVGPVLLRTVRFGIAVSVRFLVMSGLGDTGGEWVSCRFGWPSAVCLRDNSVGRASGRCCDEDDEAKAGVAGGV